ncbi:MAG: bifunctional UDP-sugar hydrolase/5'-nucleotidase [Rikenellaceae bacterium]
MLSTNDIHATFEQMPKVVTFANELRSRSENLIVLDAGDHCTGNPYVDMAEPQGAPIHMLINMVGYDYGAVGNHEFDYKLLGYKKGIETMGLQTLCANANFEGTILEGHIKPYDIFEVDGIRVAIVSFIQIDDSGLPSSMPENMEGITFVDGVTKSQEYKFLRDSADLVIGLIHLGFESDSLMVCQNPMFDIIIGGHSHTHIPTGRVINGVLVTQTGSRLKGVGVSNIRLKNGEVILVTNQVVSLSDVERDPVAQRFVEECKVTSPLNNPIGKVDITLSKVGLINMVSDVIRERSGADIAIQNSGSIRIDSLSRGVISESKIYELEPFRNTIVTQKLALEQIKEMIITKFNGTGSESRTIDLSTSGMTYEIYVGEDGLATSVKCYDIHGKEMADRVYRVATSNYVNSAYIYAGKGKATPLDGGVFIAETVVSAIKRCDTYKGDNQRRVSIIKPTI